MAQHLYRHFDAAGRLLYVGVSLNALSRLAQHRVISPWFDSIARVEIEGFDTRADALAAERAAIRAESPAHNVAHVRPAKTNAELQRAQRQARSEAGMAEVRGMFNNPADHAAIRAYTAELGAKRAKMGAA